MSQSVLVVAGEISGDLHLAGLVRAARAANPELRFWGIAGDASQAEGVDLAYHTRDMAVLGLAEVLRRYRFFRRVFRELEQTARKRRPDAVLLVDYPGFNLRFAARMKRLGIPVVYYICPQVWAWHRSRIQHMARVIDRLLVIFPFEKELFEGTGLRVDFVGHPLVDEARRAREKAPATFPWADHERVALLPGSREQEIERILPPMWKAAGLLEKRLEKPAFLLAAPSARIAQVIRRVAMETSGGPSRSQVITGNTRDVLRSARAALVASGTATLEAALMHCPMLVVYRTSWPTYLAGRLLIRVPHLGMVNLVAGSEVCPEFLQHRARPRNLAEALLPLVRETPERAAMQQTLLEVEQALGEGGAARHAAECLLEEL